MDYSLESKIWYEAQATFAGEAFDRVVEHAVSSYRRRPGYTSEERLHAADIGENGVRHSWQRCVSSITQVRAIPFCPMHR
jgi:hypothetical protein